MAPKYARDPVTKLRREIAFITQLASTTQHYLPEGNRIPLDDTAWRTVRMRPQVLRTADLLVARYKANNPGKSITPTEAIAACLQRGLAALVREDDFLPPA